MFINLMRIEHEMLEQFYLPVTSVFIKIVSAFLIFIIGLIVGKFAGLIVASLLQELKIDEILETIGVKFFISKIAGTAVSIIVYIAGLILALNQLGIAEVVAIAIGALFAVIIILAVLLGAADMIRNFFAGLALRKKYLLKKSISLPTVNGKIVEVGYTKIKVLTKEKDVLVVPFMALD